MLVKLKPLSLALSGSALLVLCACGGGSDSSTPPEAPITTKLTGTVTVDQAIQNSIVCLDLNANSACDAGEPASQKTAADGAFSLSYRSDNVTAAQAAAASLIATIAPGAATAAGTSLDAARPGEAATAAPYVLRQIPGNSGAINPLTTLVAAGVAAGMTEAASRANVAIQLGIEEAKIDGYQDEPVTEGARLQDTAHSMAVVTAAALEAGIELKVADQAAAVGAQIGALSTLRYFDAANYYLRTLDIVAKAQGEIPLKAKDSRSGMTKGTATAEASLYTQAYNANGVWTYCNASALLSIPQGTPSRSTYCSSQQSASFNKLENIAGQSMASMVTAMQADASSNTINVGESTDSLLAALGTNTFPAEAHLRKQVSVTLSQPLVINNVSADGLNPALITLEQVIAGTPSSAVNLATGRGTLGLGSGTSDTRSLRMAFTGTTSPSAGTVQFYECDLNATQTVLSACAPTQSGTYAIAIVDGVRALRYSGHAETVLPHTRLHAEVASIAGLASTGPRVYVVRENKPSAAAQSVSTRLDNTAWAAMRSVLGL